MEVVGSVPNGVSKIVANEGGKEIGQEIEGKEKGQGIEGSEECINQRLQKIRYEVRGPLVQRAAEIERQISKGVRYPFTKVIYANIGDCHALNQQPITYLRQVLSLSAWPALLKESALNIPEDVRSMVALILQDCKRSSIGAYSPALGLRSVRELASQYITQRDGHSALANNVVLGAGATDLIHAVLSLLDPSHACGMRTGVMIPVPQYPVFSGTLAELGLAQVDYYLDENRGWSLEVSELERAYATALADGIRVRGLVVINPGNPTGQILSRESIEEVIRFAHKHSLLLLADEVYQENVVAKTFISFRKVCLEMDAKYSKLELASFLTCSKGWAAECGLRAAYVELLNFSDAAWKALEAARALRQCPNVAGQVALSCVVRSPRPQEPSYACWKKERNAVYKVLANRAKLAYEELNDIPGISCNPIEGSMFAFPRLELPAGAVRAAKSRGLEPDQLYCMEFLENHGVCVVPGSGFGQLPGTAHFRTTILHEENELRHMLAALRQHHADFTQKYA